MCGRTSLYVDPDIIEERFDVEIAFEYEPRYNITPTENLATIRNTDKEHVVEQEWGLLPHWAEDTDEESRPINTRAETVAENNIFKQAFAERRCLVLADGFYEGRTPSNDLNEEEFAQGRTTALELKMGFEHVSEFELFGSGM